MSKKSYYYSIDDDIALYPDAWCIIVVGGRNTGKTYGALKSCWENKRKFAFMKRLIDDIDLLCSGKFGADLSPFKSVNRDLDINVKAKKLSKGLGAFTECDEDDEPADAPIGYLLALAAVQKFKGFDLSDCEWEIFDEMMPQLGERVNKREGEILLDSYKTISRDREHRGLKPLKLIMFSNATNVSTPVTDTLEVTDDLVEMDLLGEEYRYIEDRGILLHMLEPSPEFKSKEEESHIYKAMKGTAWGDMALENSFGYNDFTSVGRISLKGFKPYIEIEYKRHFFYVYVKDGLYYMTNSRTQHAIFSFNLNKENDQKKFYSDVGIDLRNECIDGNMIFEKYSMYDLIVNYKKKFDI